MCAVKTAVCHVKHGRVDGTHGGVLNVHTGASRADCISAHLTLALSARLSFSLFLLSALFLFSVTMTIGTRPVGSLGARGSDLP